MVPYHYATSKFARACASLSHACGEFAPSKMVSPLAHELLISASWPAVVTGVWSKRLVRTDTVLIISARDLALHNTVLLPLDHGCVTDQISMQANFKSIVSSTDVRIHQVITLWSQHRIMLPVCMQHQLRSLRQGDGFSWSCEACNLAYWAQIYSLRMRATMQCCQMLPTSKLSEDKCFLRRSACQYAQTADALGTITFKLDTRVRR